MLGEKFRGAFRASAAAAAVVLAGCSGTGETGLEPLGEASPTESGTASRGDATDTRPATSTPVPESNKASGSNRTYESNTAHEAEPEALRTEVDELLSRYDEAFAALAADPLSAMDDSTTAVRSWQAEVLIGTRLDRHVRANLHTDAELNRVLYRPDEAGVLLVTHAQHVTGEPDGSVTFEVCQFTPWHEVDADNGEVLDDRPVKRTGSATAVRTADGRLVLEHLGDDRQIELPSGSGDPCA
jgi:hypothetical protein